MTGPLPIPVSRSCARNSPGLRSSHRAGPWIWNTYDPIVTELARRDISIIAVITETPSWARSIGASWFRTLPLGARIAGSVCRGPAGQVRRAIGVVQPWDNPNLSSGWGGDAATGEVSEPYLEALWQGARTGNPAGTDRFAGALRRWPTSPMGRATSGSCESLLPRRAVHRILMSSASSCDGGVYSPDDRRVSDRRVNMSRAILFRELMVREGDNVDAVWATSSARAASESRFPRRAGRIRDIGDLIAELV